jgi:DNA polymerase type B, organellar and viral
VRSFMFVHDEPFQREKKRREAHRLAQAKYLYRYPDERSNHHSQAEIASMLARTYGGAIMWDGEGPKDTGYSLFGNSLGASYEICHPRLRTDECLDLIYWSERNNPDAINIGYGFNYDVSCILGDMPKHCFINLIKTNHCLYGDWQLEHIPGKWFQVKRGEVICKIFDIYSFFGTGYVRALVDFGIGTEEELALLTSEKARRPDFLWTEIEEIREYMRLELKLGPYLFDAIRTSFCDAGLPLRSWHGPGAAANKALSNNHVYKAMKDSPKEVLEAARYAYAGGHIEQFIVGYIKQDIYEADIRTAYPTAAARYLPNLTRGEWRKGRDYEPGKFAVYHIQYEAPRDMHRSYPLFCRTGHSVCWPNRVEGWYWAPEAELVADDPDATFLEAWIYDEEDPTDRPFAFLQAYYDRRALAKRQGLAIQYAFKTASNAIYGQLAKRAGWTRRKRAPRSHQLEWAGFITSWCRAEVYKAAQRVGDKLISYNTDSIQALCPLDHLERGDQMGQWDIQHYSEGIFWQSGIYFLKESLGYDPSYNNWVKAKTRGIPKGKYTAEQLLEAFEGGGKVELDKTTFIGYGLAYQIGWDQLNKWVTEPHEYELGGDPAGKRVHPRMHGKLVGCRNNCEGDTHRLINHSMWQTAQEVMVSEPHWLPWLDPPDSTKQAMDVIMAWDLNALEGWESDYEL